MLKRIFTRRRTLAFLAMTLFAGGGGAGLSLLYPGFGPATNADGETATETASDWSKFLSDALVRANNEESDKPEAEPEEEDEKASPAPAPNLPPPPESFGDDKGFVPSPPGASGGGYEPTPAPPSFNGFANVSPAVGGNDDKQSPSEAAPSQNPISQPPSFGTPSPSANAVAPPADLNANGLRSGGTTDEQALPQSAPEPYYEAALPREVTQQELYGAGPQEDPYAESAPAPPTANYGTPNPYAPQASAIGGAGTYGGPSGAAGRLAPDYGAEPLPGSRGPGAGVPGSRALEGIQSADVKLVKNAPAEIQVGVPATFELKVLNASEKEVRDVVVRDQTPKGTRFLEGSPQPSALADGTLVWNVGSLKPQEELTITMRVMPEQEGEIGSVATVMFAAEASARTVCTKPRLAIEVTGPANVLIGQPAECQLVIANEGTGAAIGVAIEADLPPQFKHPAGAQLEYEIGALQPGESKTLPLSLVAAEAGATSFPMRVRAEGVPGAEDMLTTEVIAPQLAVAAKGPTRRYIQRQAKYEIFVQNPGTAPAQEVELAAYLPRGMQFVQANNSGSYDPETHAVYWSLAELPTQERGSVEVAVMPVEEGEQKIRVEAGALLELQAESELGVVVEAQVDLDFEIASLNDPIEIGADSIYEIRVANLGTKAATGVVIAASFPPGLQPLPDQAGSYRVEGQRIVFTNVSRLEPGDEIVVKAAARGAAEGDHRVGVEVASAEVTTPILKEARTKVYRDQ